MKRLYIYELLGSLLLGSCAAEAPFEGPGEPERKLVEFPKSALDFDVMADEDIKVQTRAGEDEVNLDDFVINFLRNDGTNVKTVKYGEMPDIIMLPQGTYTISATYGDKSLDAAWNNPVFDGISGEFNVTKDEISTIDPIKCYLSNVKVNIDFSSLLTDAMSDDSYVEVKVANRTGLQYNKETGNKSGYFRVENEETLVATFNGKINGADVSETKSLSNITSGCLYQITFKLHSTNGSDVGDTDAAVQIDATVNYENIQKDITVEDEPLTDSERPDQGGTGNDDPGNDNDPDNTDNPDNPQNEGPTVTPYRPEGSDPNAPLVDINSVNNANGLICALNVKSQAEGGITAFNVVIESPILTEDELKGIGLAKNLNLIDPGLNDKGEPMTDALSGLGFPVENEVKGATNLNFDITSFMPMLSLLGSGEHSFILTITDANGTTEVVLKIKS